MTGVKSPYILGKELPAENAVTGPEMSDLGIEVFR